MGERHDGHETGKRNADLSGCELYFTIDIRPGASYDRLTVWYMMLIPPQRCDGKEDQGNWEFVVPQKLKELYNSQDYGRYGKNGEMPVCFIVNTDNTGGNSGSPVFNSKGQLVGTAFDRNFEGLTGDIAFRPSSQRAACVDIRYTLFIIDKYAGASHIIDELSIE